MMAYVLFGSVFFETWLPMSVQRKALTASEMFSPQWFDATKVISAEFANALIGKSAYWYTRDTFFPVMVVLCVIGCVLSVIHKRASVLPLMLITVAYVAAFTASGSSYARNFPWYFAPILPAAYLMSGYGITCVISRISKELPPHKVAAGPHDVSPAIAWWLTFSFLPLNYDARTLADGWKNRRERVYATAAVWAGKHIGHNVAVATNEIGAMGFFLPQEATMIDMFGLLSRKGTLGMPYVDQIRKESPQCIFVRSHFHSKQTIESAMGTAYQWRKFESLDIGIRSDLMPSLERGCPISQSFMKRSTLTKNTNGKLAEQK